MKRDRCLLGLFFLALFFFFESHLHGEIVPIHHLSEMGKGVKPGSLLFFDLDDTLFRDASCLRTGGKRAQEWLAAQVDDREIFYQRYQELVEKGEDFVPKTLWERFLFAEGPEELLLEKETPHLLQEFEQRGSTIYGLTAREGGDLSVEPILKKLEIDFLKGILFANLSDKGEFLKRKLQEKGLVEEPIVFVDNCLDHCLSVEREFPNGVIYHYLAVEDQFDPTLAQIQINYFEKHQIVLSDLETVSIPFVIQESVFGRD